MKELIDTKPFEDLKKYYGGKVYEGNGENVSLMLAYDELLKMARGINYIQKNLSIFKDVFNQAQNIESECKHCPWCGATPRIDEVYDAFYIFCKNDDCIVKPVYRHTTATKQEAINAWNKRK